jgi:hypothetical protein
VESNFGFGNDYRADRNEVGLETGIVPEGGCARASAAIQQTAQPRFQESPREAGGPVGDQYRGWRRLVSEDADQKPLAVAGNVVHAADSDARRRAIEQTVNIPDLESRTSGLHACRHDLVISGQIQGSTRAVGLSAQMYVGLLNSRTLSAGQAIAGDLYFTPDSASATLVTVDVAGRSFRFPFAAPIVGKPQSRRPIL